MEIKKQQEREGRSQEKSKFKIREWIEEIKHEIKTIQWTSKEELRLYTQIVVGATFVFGMAVYLVDLMISGTLNTLTWLSRLIFG